MEVSKEKIEKIFKTLPIGYYIKKKVDVEIGNDDRSYYDPMNDKIVVSSLQIQTLFNDIDSIFDEELEIAIRTLLYHETSHAFITPKSMFMSRIMNIFEDERIESILRHYYMNTNFRDFVIKVNNYHGEEPTNKDSFFYYLVRFRVGPKHLLKKVHDLIVKWSKLTSSTKRYYGVSQYEKDVQELYDEACVYFNQQQRLKSLSNDTSKEINDILANLENFDSTNDNAENDDTENNTEETQSDDTSTSKHGQGESAEHENDDFNEDDEFDLDNANEVVSAIINKFVDNEISSNVNSILRQYKSVSKNNGSAINAYSGKFDPRSVIRDDYKYFVQTNRLGHVKQFSKLHLNLFIDSSGSFHNNDIIVNKLLYSLKQFELESSNFEFDLISCGLGQEIRAKNDRVQRSDGYNRLTHEIFSQFKSLQKPNVNNFNIVLFDGDAFSGVYKAKMEDKHTFKAFDTSNTIIISDEENKQAISRFVSTAKVIITKNYVEELKSNIFKALQTFVK